MARRLEIGIREMVWKVGVCVARSMSCDRVRRRPTKSSACRGSALGGPSNATARSARGAPRHEEHSWQTRQCQACRSEGYAGATAGPGGGPTGGGAGAGGIAPAQPPGGGGAGEYLPPLTQSWCHSFPYMPWSHVHSCQYDPSGYITPSHIRRWPFPLSSTHGAPKVHCAPGQ